MSDEDLVTVLAQNVRHALRDVDVVVDDEDPALRLRESLGIRRRRMCLTAPHEEPFSSTPRGDRASAFYGQYASDGMGLRRCAPGHASKNVVHDLPGVTA